MIIVIVSKIGGFKIHTWKMDLIGDNNCYGFYVLDGLKPIPTIWVEPTALWRLVRTDPYEMDLKMDRLKATFCHGFYFVDGLKPIPTIWVEPTALW